MKTMCFILAHGWINLLWDNLNLMHCDNKSDGEWTFKLIHTDACFSLTY